MTINLAQNTNHYSSENQGECVCFPRLMADVYVSELAQDNQNHKAGAPMVPQDLRHPHHIR